MPNIKPISDLRNYTVVVNELDKQKALNSLMNKLNEAEVSIRDKGTVSADDLEAELGEEYWNE